MFTVRETNAVHSARHRDGSSRSITRKPRLPQQVAFCALVEQEQGVGDFDASPVSTFRDINQRRDAVRVRGSRSIVFHEGRDLAILRL
jgi:hypothetical protein